MKIKIEVDLDNEEVVFKGYGGVIRWEEMELEYDDRVKLKFLLMRFNCELRMDD